MGLVLAKGVVFSLISTFFVLPGLILIFNKLIEKTKKKSPTIKMDKIANFSYKYRFLLLALFILLFAGSYFLKGNLGIYYMDDSNNEISNVFNEENEIAVIYKNKDEEIISNYCRQIDKDKRLNRVLCYGNTLNESIKYNEVNQKITDLGLETSIKDYLLKLVYYKYYSNENNEISFNELIDFINEVVYANKDIEIDDSKKDAVSRLSTFTNYNNINGNKNAYALSNMLGIDKNTIEDLMIYYNSIYLNNKISLYDFIEFMKKNVINNSKYNVNNSTKENINRLSNLINIKDNNLDAQRLSNILNISINDVEKIIILNLLNNEINDSYSLYEFTTLIINNQEALKDYTDEELFQTIKSINTITNPSILNVKLDSNVLSSLFNIDLDKVNYIMSLTGETEYTQNEFINILINNGFVTDENKINELSKLQLIINSEILNKKYNYQEISELFNISTEKVKAIYAMFKSKSEKISLNMACFFSTFIIAYFLSR